MTARGDGGAAEPLARLLAMGFRLLIDGLHERLRVEGWTDVRPAFGFVLLAARDAPTTNAHVATLMGTTKQAASKLLDLMEDAGYVDRTAGALDGRVKAVALTSRGRQLLTVVERIYADLESGWAAVIGERATERLRQDLTRVLVHANGGALPPARPTW